MNILWILIPASCKCLKCDRIPEPFTDMTTMVILLTPIYPVDLLISLAQDGHPLEEYVEEFLELAHLVPWNDGTLKSIVWAGLDNHIFRKVPVAATTRP